MFDVVLILILGLTSVFTARAAAQSDAGAPPAVDAPVGPATASAGIDERYHTAFVQLARGERQAAVRSLRKIVREVPEHPLAKRAVRLIRALEEPKQRADSRGQGRRAPPAEAPGPLATETPTGIARAEMSLFQMMHGVALGAEMCVLLDCEDAQPWVVSLMLGGGAGFGASWVASGGGVRPGLARALTTGTMFGFANGLWLSMATGTIDDSDREDSVVAHLMLGQLAGLVGGGGLYYYLQPTTGQVSLTSSGGLWLATVMAELVGALELEMSVQAWGVALLTATNLGLVGGGLLASRVRMSPGRVLLIDGGGVLGLLAGAGVSVLFQGSDIEQGPTLAAGLAGTLTGLGFASYLTRAWDAEPTTTAAVPPRFSITPLSGGMGATLAGMW